jgi:hypothetical protein
MSTLYTIVKDYDKNIVLRDCQRQAFEYLHDKKGDLSVTTFETTFETFTEIESPQGPTTLYGRLYIQCVYTTVRFVFLLL